MSGNVSMLKKVTTRSLCRIVYIFMYFRILQYRYYRHVRFQKAVDTSDVTVCLSMYVPIPNASQYEPIHPHSPHI